MADELAEMLRKFRAKMTAKKNNFAVPRPYNISNI
jgi:hypothetical protein